MLAIAGIPVPHGMCPRCKAMKALHQAKVLWDQDEFVGVKGRCSQCGKTVREPAPVKYSETGNTKPQIALNSTRPWLPGVPCPKCFQEMLMLEEDDPFIEAKCFACGKSVPLVGSMS